MTIGDYTRAHENYTKHLEAYEMLYGDNDKKTIDAAQLVQVYYYYIYFFIFYNFLINNYFNFLHIT